MDVKTLNQCRLCLKQCPSDSKEFKDVESLYRDMNEVQQSRNKSDPHLICKLCFNNLIRMFCFRTRCTRTELQLRESGLEMVQSRCRVCLIELEKEKTVDVIKVAHLFYLCSGFKLQENDRDKEICIDCYGDIYELQYFIKFFKETELKLKHIPLNKKKETYVKSYGTRIEKYQRGIKLHKLIENHQLEMISIKTSSRHRHRLIVRQETDQNQNTFYFCDKCPLSVPFRTKQTLLMHMKRKHLPRFQPFVCENCAELFGSEKLYHNHVTIAHTANEDSPARTHPGFSRIECPICSQRFKTSKGLEEHHKKWHSISSNVIFEL